MAHDGCITALTHLELVAEYFSADVNSIMNFKNKKSIVVDDDVLGIVCPTYMSDIPWIVKALRFRLR